jgi:hypothetical protein
VFFTNITAYKARFIKITQNAAAQFTTALYFKVAVVVGNPLHSRGKKSKHVVWNAEELVYD